MVRVFLPDAEPRSRCSTTPATTASCRASTTPACSPGRSPCSDRHYRLRARFGDDEVEMEDPYRFPPILSDLDLYLLGEGTHLRALRQARRPSDGARRRRRRRLSSVFAPNARRVSVVGDFNFWDGRRHAMRVRGNGFWEIFIPGARAGDKYKYEIIGRDGQLLPLKSDPVAFAAEVRPVDRLDRGRRDASCRGRRRARWQRQRARRADLDLRGASRLVAAQARGGRSLADLSRARRATAGLRRRHGLHPCRAAADHRASVRRLVGLSADRAVRADQPVRLAGGFRRAGRRLPPRRARRAARLGAGPFPRRSARARPLRRHRALRARQSACRAGISTGTR